MRLRYAGHCRMCKTELPAGASAIYERNSKTVRCLTCGSAPKVVAAEPHIRPDVSPREVDPGVPGASARREYERRQARRENRIRSEHRKLGGLILAVSKDPQSNRAWDTGALGEERLGTRLNELAGESLRVLHDRRIPGTSANIDHLAVTPSGVFVIDAKRYQGRPRLVVEGGLVRPRVEKLVVGSRDRTKVVEGVLKQLDVVRDVVGNAAPVRGVLCFIDADWPLIGGSFTVRGVDVVWPKKLYPQLSAPGPLRLEHVGGVHRLLAETLPPACVTS